MQRSTNNVGIRIFIFLAFKLRFVHAKYIPSAWRISNMAVCCDDDVNDVTAPHV